jgi:hypothetical protein
VVITVGDAAGRRGDVVGFAVTIDTLGQNVGSAALCIGFNPATPINVIGGAPDCTLEGGITGSFVFEPTGCTPGDDCTRACAAVSDDRIINGATLFACRVAIDAGAPLGEYGLECTAADARGPDDAPLGALCNDGLVIVQDSITGDCNGDGEVTIDELIRGVNIALDLAPITECPAFDTDANGQVTIEELIAAVNNALA